MGRGKIEIKKIENVNSRQVTFSKRRGGLMKKAKELSVLCACDIGVIIYSNTGKKYEYTNLNSMDKILDRYNKDIAAAPASSSNAIVELQQNPQSEAAVIREELAKLRSKYQQMHGKGLEGLDCRDLQQLEQQLYEGLSSVRDKKERLLIEQYEKSKFQMEELKQSLKSSCSADSNSWKRKRILLPDEGCLIDKEAESENFLRLGLFTTGCCVDLIPKTESNSNESTAQIEMAMDAPLSSH
ncbi:MADS-box transcription factor 23-like [Amaranthus tricolor]|uniref:MADS-box transcription factor 23-like n=1 Tax=Amaranthus tricolor TaxID=29722 RepID=UPI002587A9D2|nr:MADS-box transcription factor 23-like [Amaranthus tricolor]